MSVPSFRVVQVDRSSDQILKNLMEHYLHDMAEWFEFDSREDGSYSYDTNQFWNDGVAVFLAYSDTVPIAFAIVGSGEKWIGDKTAHDLTEFFVIRRYRRKAVGRILAEHVWGKYPGKWVVRVFQRNLPALPFWRAAVSVYTGGAFDEDIREMEGHRWSYFTFQKNAH
ncbi:MAG: hypothetical protein O7G86_02040 [Gammaproteobacteria bacterium]|nr:hypothetical protein [Gammaproteobacteria bacterium]